jgi:hypothetical protein
LRYLRDPAFGVRTKVDEGRGAILSRVADGANQQKVLFGCPACGAPHVLGPDTHEFPCRVCAHVTRFYACKTCRTTFPSQYDPMPEGADEASRSDGPDLITCGGCNVTSKVRALRRGRLIASRADWGPLKTFYARFGLDFADTVQFSGRRVIFGDVLLTSGLNDLDQGLIMVSFDRHALYVFTGDGFEVPYGKVRLFEILSREEVLAIPSRDLVASLAADALSMKKVTPSESIIAVAWDEGSFVVLNRALRPKEMAYALADYVTKARPGPPSAP